MSMLSSFLRKTGLNKPLKTVVPLALAGSGLGLLSKIPAVGGALSGIGKAASKVPGASGIGNTIKSVGKYALDNADLLLGGLSAYEGYNKSKDADKMLDRALNDPSLRPERPDLSATFGGYSNPYSGGQAAIPSVGRRNPANVLPPHIEDAIAPPPIPGGMASVGTRHGPQIQRAY